MSEIDCNATALVCDDLCREVYCVLGVPIDAIDMADVSRSIEGAAAKAVPFLISTPNLNFLITSQTDAEFRESLLSSDLCPPDGMPIIWIARLIGIPIKRRIAGSDIFESLKSRTGNALKLFLFGSTEDVAARAAERINSGDAGLKCVGWACPEFVNVQQLSEDRYIDRINASNADFLVAALGAKKGQVWLLRNHFRLRVPIRAHLGATINFQAGAVRRAPRMLQQSGLEWLWRIKEEPALFGRYWYDGTALLRLLFTQVLPLAIRERWRRVRPDSGRHDFVIVEGDGGLTIRILGEAGAVQVPRAIALFRGALALQRPISVDLSRTPAIDSRFFGLFLMLRKRLKTMGASLQFVGVSASLERQFRLHGVGYLLSPDRNDHVDTVH